MGIATLKETLQQELPDVISPMIGVRARPVAGRLGIEMYSNSSAVEAQ